MFSRNDQPVIIYSYGDSRLNIPVNVLVGFKTLEAGFGRSDEEVYDHFCFDVSSDNPAAAAG